MSSRSILKAISGVAIGLAIVVPTAMAAFFLGASGALPLPVIAVGTPVLLIVCAILFFRKARVVKNPLYISALITIGLGILLTSLCGAGVLSGK